MPWRPSGSATNKLSGKAQVIQAHGTNARGLSIPEERLPVVLTTGRDTKIDPVKDYQAALTQLKKAISDTEILLVSATRMCSTKEGSNSCEHNREVLEVRGRMRRLQVALKQVAGLKPVAFLLRNQAHNASDTLQNETAKLTTAQISMRSVILSREAVHKKMETLEKLEDKWRTDVKDKAKELLDRRKEREKAEAAAQTAEEHRLQFLSQLNAVLEGVEVGDKAAELTYEEAEDTLHKAERRELKAKKKIIYAERLVDSAYSKQAEVEQAQQPVNIFGKGTPIVRPSDDSKQKHQDLDDWGAGSTSDHPLPLIPHTLIAGKRRHRRARHAAPGRRHSFRHLRKHRVPRRAEY